VGADRKGNAEINRDGVNLAEVKVAGINVARVHVAEVNVARVHVEERPFRAAFGAQKVSGFSP
jgi:hypothetical protein